MTPTRVSAIGANICFIIYGSLAGLYPVLFLHLLLLPINLKRLLESLGHLNRRRAGSMIDEWRLGQASGGPIPLF